MRSTAPLKVDEIYNPTDEQTNAAQIVACHWELLRRNAVFRELVGRWKGSARARFEHASSADYYNEEIHFPRCALDWLLTPTERLELFRHQLRKRRIFVDACYNFGPIVICCDSGALERNPHAPEAAIEAKLLPGAPSPLRIDQSWPQTPSPFRDQFAMAVTGPTFAEITERLKQGGALLRWIGDRIALGDSPDQLSEFAHDLHHYGKFLRDTSEFHRVYTLPRDKVATPFFKPWLAELRKNHVDDTYTAQENFLGTAKAWHYFLIADANSLKPDDAGDMNRLAKLYSKELKQGKVPGPVNVRALRYAGKGSVLTTQRIAARRKTVGEFIRRVQRWRDVIYPPSEWARMLRSGQIL